MSYGPLIKSFADDATREVFDGADNKKARQIPKDIWPTLRRKLDLLDTVTRVDALRVPPGNRLEALKGDRAGYFSIRVNDQYRLTFRFEGENAEDVKCEDYH